MDTIFVLGQESRQRILQRAAARLPGCAYLCAWAPVLPPVAAGLQQQQQQLQLSSSLSSSAAGAARLLCCLDAWLPGSDDGGGGVSALFDAYRGSVCAAVTGCVPGWAHVDRAPYMELPELDLAASSSLPVQQRFYQEAGIKMAAFMGCESGEIEVGFSTAPNGDSGGGASSLQSSMEQVFSEDFFQESLLEELLQLPPTGPSSSSSSLVGSPADGASTSLLRAMTPMVTSSSATPSPREPAVQAVATTPSSSSSSRLHPRPPPHRVHVSPFARHGVVLHFPSAEADDAAMAQAMLDVICSPTTPSAWSSSPALPTSAKHRPWIRSPRRATQTTAFRAYNAALAPRPAALRRPPGAPGQGQRMIKMGISILRRMHMVRCSQERTAVAAASTASRRANDDDDEATAALPAPTSSQLHHMISERRRRERLNESFEQLRTLLPPGSKKDKATVLAKTLEYMNLLIAQISELEAKNRALQTQVQQRANGSSPMIRAVNEVHHHHQWPAAAGGPSPERVEVHVVGGGGAPSSSSSEVVTVRVTARAEGGVDVSELVLALLKEAGGFTVVSVDARQPAGGGGNGGGAVAQATLTLRATAAEFDEASLKEAVTKAVESLVAPPPPLP